MFCLKGVYALNERGEVFVKDGFKCVNGCHGCEWQCPCMAITFPEPITEQYMIKVLTHYKEKGKPFPDAYRAFLKKRYSLDIDVIEKNIYGKNTI
jgi:Fe-S-cluster-containing dehydrogenase component